MKTLQQQQKKKRNHYILQQIHTKKKTNFCASPRIKNFRLNCFLNFQHPGRARTRDHLVPPQPLLLLLLRRRLVLNLHRIPLHVLLLGVVPRIIRVNIRITTGKVRILPPPISDPRRVPSPPRIHHTTLPPQPPKTPQNPTKNHQKTQDLEEQKKITTQKNRDFSAKRRKIPKPQLPPLPNQAIMASGAR